MNPKDMVLNFIYGRMLKNAYGPLLNTVLVNLHNI